MEERKDVITEEDFERFLAAKTDGERMKILLEHSQKNQNAIQLKHETDKSGGPSPASGARP